MTEWRRHELSQQIEFQPWPWPFCYFMPPKKLIFKITFYATEEARITAVEIENGSK